MIRKLMRSQSGASLVEFALLAPVMIFLLVGVIDIGRYTFFAILAANAARAGASYGSYDLSTANDISGMEAAAEADGQNFTQWDNVTATNLLCTDTNGVASNCAPSNGGQPGSGQVYYVQVIVTGHFKPLVQYPGISGSGPSTSLGIPITGSATMRVVSQ
jgi:Flp pilus assembly protein TadG